MSNLIWLAMGMAAVAWIAFRAVPIWVDSARRAMPLAYRARWMLVGIVAPSRYWWGARIEAMSHAERSDLLEGETASLDVSRADSLRCPLCKTEIRGAWMLDENNRPTVAPVKCPQCDFRLNACRHCTHFMPGSPRVMTLTLGGDDMTFGRCGFFKTPQPVDQITTPEAAKRLKERGYESLNAPMPMVDSFMPPDFCRAFQIERKRLQVSGVRWPDARRAALLRLIGERRHRDAAPHDAETTSPEEPSGDEPWLM